MTPTDIRVVESRIAELSGAPPRMQLSAPARVGAFEDLLCGSTDTATPYVSSRAPLPAGAVERLIAGACAANGPDAALIKAIVANESGFDPAATSPAGAQGLMQLMPDTAAGLGVRDAYDPAQNIAGGTRYLGQLLARFNGDVPAALAAYNAGPNAVVRGEIPVETRRYVRSVLESYARYRAAHR